VEVPAVLGIIALAYYCNAKSRSRRAGACGCSAEGIVIKGEILDRQEHRRRESLDHPSNDPVRSLGSDLRHHVLVGDHLAELALEGKIARVACDLVRQQ